MSQIHKRDKGSATTERQNKRKPAAITKPVETASEPTPDLIIADMSMKRAELIEIADAMELSTTGTKQELIDRIQA